MKTFFIRALESKDKASALLEAMSQNDPVDVGRFHVDPTSLASIPGSPFAYWVGGQVRSLFKTRVAVEANGRIARIGLTTHDDFRWLRLTWEASTQAGLVCFAKGGEFARFYSNIHLAILWNHDGRELKASKLERLRQGELTENNSRCWNEPLYFRRGLTWPRRTQGGLSIRVLPAGCIFGDKGPAVFLPQDDRSQLLAILSVLNSQAFRALVDLQMAFGSYEVGVIRRTPVPDVNGADEARLASLARRAWSLKRSLDARVEVSHAFVLPALLQAKAVTLNGRAAGWNERLQKVEIEIAAIQAEVDQRCFALYGINDEDRQAITKAFGASTDHSEAAEVGTTEDAEDEDEGEAETSADAAALAAELVSWAAGVAFGRFDVRLAIGDRPPPSEPEPFDPLPVCSPGMLAGDDGLPLACPPAGYPLSFPDDGILIDDPGHPRDLTAAVRAVFEAILGSRADAMWQEAAALLDPRDHDLRRWLASGFFEHHLPRYSKSRRKAPILWQLGIPSARFSVWCYAHRMTRDSLLTIQNDVVGPKLATEERRFSSLITQAGESPSARERAEIATQESLVVELRTLADEVTRVAPLWNPDLDDGIVLVLAPLWRLVPTHKAWQKELRTKWDELVAGKYDWAHVAMHLWPERVVPKCATDRSLAIAHGLEDVLWVEGTDGKWSPAKKPARPIADLIADRTSPAVKAALAALLEAQQPLVAAKRRGRTSQEAS